MKGGNAACSYTPKSDFPQLAPAQRWIGANSIIHQRKTQEQGGAGCGVLPSTCRRAAPETGPEMDWKQAWKGKFPGVY